MLAANTKQEHGRCVSVKPAAKPAATQLTSIGIENSWTIVAALPAVGNPHIKSAVVCKRSLKVPPTVSCASDAHVRENPKRRRRS